MFDFSNTIHNATQHVFGIFVPHEKMFILYLLTSFGIAWLVWRAQIKREKAAGGAKDFFSYIFSPSIYNHQSSWQDYFIFLINGLLYYGIIEQFVLSERAVSVFMHQVLIITFGSPDHPILKSVAGLLLVTLVMALLFDLSVYCAHYMLHKIPALWAFHKVHHSAEVMTPITLLRTHPIELILNAIAFAVFVGFGIGIFSYLTMQEMSDARILGANAIVFISLITGIHLRHSHVWLHYPAWLSRFLISPAQHQIHHSTQVCHFDKNLGLIFPFWDKIFSTLYVPKEREELEFGINKRARNPYASVKQMYLQPFKECCAFFQPKKESE